MDDRHPTIDEVEFDALIEPLVWGRNVYTVLRVNRALEDLQGRLGPGGSRARSTTCP